jgi:hypothetical protein
MTNPSLKHSALRQVLEEFSWLFCTMKPLFKADYKWLWIKYSHLTIGISFMMSALLFGIELAYSHNVLFRFIGLMEIDRHSPRPTNPELGFTICISLVLGINSFYYEYSIHLLGFTY